MIVALSVVACVLVLIGLGSIVQGMPIVRLEAGWTMVIAGTVATTGGLLLAGVAVLASGLRRLEGVLGRESPRFPPMPAPPASFVVPAAVAPPRSEPAAAADGEPDRSAVEESSESRAILAADALLPESADAPLSPSATLLPAEELAPAPEAVPSAIVGTYASGGNSYIMYADGTIRADTPRGEFTFRSLDELKAFVAAGGEEGAPKTT